MMLVADPHLTDIAADEYRWDFFASLALACKERGDDRVVILGDLTDRKDRHSASLVNRLITELVMLRDALGADSRIDIIMGNHDMPLKGDPFWSFLQHIEGVSFYTEPTWITDKGLLLFLPYNDNPKEAWKALDLSKPACIFIHQLVTGVVENGIEHTNENMHEMFTNTPIYAGDIHTHQKVGNVQYVGAPHPIKFGNDYDCRFLWLDDVTYLIKEVIPLDPAWKHMLDIDDVEDVLKVDVRPGDQIRLRFRLHPEDMPKWPAWRDWLSRWAAKQEARIVSMEAIVETASVRAGAVNKAPDLFTDPLVVLAAFGDAESIDESLLIAGNSILSACIASNLSA